LFQSPHHLRLSKLSRQAVHASVRSKLSRRLLRRSLSAQHQLFHQPPPLSHAHRSSQRSPSLSARFQLSLIIAAHTTRSTTSAHSTSSKLRLSKSRRLSVAVVTMVVAVQAAAQPAVRTVVALALVLTVAHARPAAAIAAHAHALPAAPAHHTTKRRLSSTTLRSTTSLPRTVTSTTGSTRRAPEARLAFHTTRSAVLSFVLASYAIASYL